MPRQFRPSVHLSVTRVYCRAGQNTPYKVFEILNTKYFVKSISNTKIPNTFSSVFQLPKYQIRILNTFFKIQNTHKATLTQSTFSPKTAVCQTQCHLVCDFL